MASPLTPIFAALLGGTWSAALVWLLLRAALRRQAAADLALQRRMDDLQGQYWTLQQRFGDLDAAPSPPAAEAIGGAGLERLYERAIRMARQGAQVEALTGACGLSRAEAELVVRLHAGSDSASRQEGRA